MKDDVWTLYELSLFELSLYELSKNIDHHERHLHYSNYLYKGLLKDE